MSCTAARRVAVTQEAATVRPHDYADTFELLLQSPDHLEPREWLSRGLDASPAIVEHLTSILLGVRDDPAARPEELADWTVLESTTDVIHIERSLPLMHVTLVGRRLASGRRLTTILTYDRPAVARPLWAVIGIGHRWAVKRLLHHGVPEAPVTAIGATGQR